MGGILGFGSGSCDGHHVEYVKMSVQGFSTVYQGSGNTQYPMLVSPCNECCFDPKIWKRVNMAARENIENFPFIDYLRVFSMMSSFLPSNAKDRELGSSDREYECSCVSSESKVIRSEGTVGSGILFM